MKNEKWKMKKKKKTSLKRWWKDEKNVYNVRQNDHYEVLLLSSQY